MASGDVDLPCPCRGQERPFGDNNGDKSSKTADEEKVKGPYREQQRCDFRRTEKKESISIIEREMTQNGTN